MLNFKRDRNEKYFNKKVKNNDVDFKEIILFYDMIVKYNSFHPEFNVNRVMLKLYPNLNWKHIVSK